ncbi:hypothetical protein LINPERPRIM_LOCUS13147 [Linum perenne]
MIKNWGVSSQANISSLGDDLWLLDWGSKELVDRILVLDRSLFGSTRIFLDRWTSIAGRTTFLQKQHIAWVWIQGIPLHLHSAELFRSLGEGCGGFLDFDVSHCPLNAVRIKVATSSDIPTRFTERFHNEVFVVRVFQETLVESSLMLGVWVAWMGRKE